MNLKKTWNKKFGKSEVISKQNSSCKLVEIDMVRLADGESKKYNEKDKEYGLLILGGKCTVTGDGFEYKNIGKRKDVFDGPAHFILDERVDADIVYIGEAYVKGGQWASYPPHKHDDDNMPTEAATEEIYYYEFKKPSGFGIQRVYTKEGDIDETYTVKSGDFVEIPRGYHPFHTAPGYDNYYLWVMAGENRGFFMTTDEEHKWLNN